MATIEDFNKIDVRVGRIIDVEDFPEAKKPAYKLKIDFGNELGVPDSNHECVLIQPEREVTTGGKLY